MRILRWLLIALLIGIGGRAQGPTPDSAPPRTAQELVARIRTVLTRTHTPGAGLALVARDSVIFTGGIGKADVASGREATGATLFRIGSTSKAFTSLVVMMLQEEGKLRLDDPIRKYIPEIQFANQWEATDPVRIANALEHTTGFDDLAFRDFASSDPTPLTLRQGLDFNSASRVSRWRPGTRVSYCNTGPPLAAYIAEKIEGRPFEEIVQQRLFDPIGMHTATYFRPDSSHLSVTTLYEADGATPSPYWHVLMRPAGSINASAEDMAPYVQFLLNRGAVAGRQLLPAADIARMEHPATALTAKAGLPVGYGLHLATYVDSGYVWSGHDGSVGTGLTTMAYLPNDGVGFAVMINSGNHAALDELNSLIRRYLTRTIPRSTPPPIVPVSSLARTRYAGWYEPDNPRTQHLYFFDRLAELTKVTVDDSGLVMHPMLGKSSRRLPVTESLFRGVDEPVATLALVDDSVDGRPVAIEQMGYMLPVSLVHMSAPVAWIEIVLTLVWVMVVLATVVVGALGLILARRRRKARRPPLRIAGGLTIVAFIAASACFAIAAGGNNAVLGTPNVWTVGSFAFSILFAVVAVISFVRTIRAGGRASGRVLQWVNRIAVTSHVVVAAYLTYWGFIGWRTWG